MSATVRECWEAWDRSHRHLGSIATEQSRWEYHLGPAFGDREAMSIGAADVDQYRIDRTAKPTRQGPRPSVATLNREVMLLHRLFNFAVSRRLIPSNPIKGTVWLLPEPPPPDAVVTEADLERLLGLIRNVEAKAWTILAFESGMRRGEIDKLTWRQLDWDAGLIHLPAIHTKARKARSVEFPERSQEALRELPERGPRVFTMAMKYLYTMYSKAVAASGITGTDGRPPTWHSLRRSYVTLMRRRGVEETVVMKLSGHATRAVFDRYNIVSPDDILGAIRKNQDGRAREIEALRSTRRSPKRSPREIFVGKVLTQGNS